MQETVDPPARQTGGRPGGSVGEKWIEKAGRGFLLPERRLYGMNYIKPLQIQAYEALKTMILNGSFERGTTYSETRISQTLGFSRTPVRDAIQHLAQEGYLDILPSKGFCIHEMTDADLIRTYQICCALEGFCAVQMAQEHKTPRARQAIEKLGALLQAQENVLKGSHAIEEFVGFDKEFHRQIVVYLDNSDISRLFDQFQFQIDQIATRSLAREGRMEETLHEHRVIMDTIRIGAVGRCYKAVLVHLGKPKDIILQNAGQDSAELA